MGFFTPWFLAGAAAVGLPIWLHLLKRHKTDPKLFPSLMFFEFRETSSVKHRRLDHILLFVLRTLMLLLLALLFASPFIRRSAAASHGENRKRGHGRQPEILSVGHFFAPHSIFPSTRSVLLVKIVTKRGC